MKILALFLLACTLTFSFIACNRGLSPGAESYSSNPTFTKAEYDNDLLNIANKEKALNDHGIRIFETIDTSVTPEVITCDVDSNFEFNFVKDHPEKKNLDQEMISVLKEYDSTIQDFLVKYHGIFKIDEGGRYMYVFLDDDNVKKELEAKKQFVEKNIQKLSNDQDLKKYNSTN